MTTEKDEEDAEEEAPEEAPPTAVAVAPGSDAARTAPVKPGISTDVRPAAAKSWRQTASSAFVGTKQQITRWPRRVRVALAGYAVVVAFVIGTGLAQVAHADRTTALVIGILLAGPLVVALIGDRITGIKAFSVEIALSQVTVSVDSDLSGAVMTMAEMGPSGTPDLLNTLSAATQSRSRILRLNLRAEDYWWASRVFLAAALAADYTSVEALVFVRSGEQRVFVGIATPEALRTQIGLTFPQYESAYRKARFEVSQPPKPPEQEVTEILSWRWGSSLPTESQDRVIVTRQNLKDWLGDQLDTDDFPDGPLSPLLRYRITSRRQRYAALTQNARLTDIVDREELARKTTLATLERQLND